MQRKFCTVCKEDDVNKFSPAGTTRCRSCNTTFMRIYWNENRDKFNQRRREFRAANPEKCRRQGAEWNERNPARNLINGSRGRARQKGLEFNLTIADITPLPERCPVLGIKLEPGTGRGSNHPNAYSLDRIDNSRGYVKGNVAVISARANRLKRDGTLEEFKGLVNWLEKVK